MCLVSMAVSHVSCFYGYGSVTRVLFLWQCHTCVVSMAMSHVSCFYGSVTCVLFLWQCHMCLSQFEESKNCLKRCLKMADFVSSEKQDKPHLERQLKAGGA